jgi:hypothetical protein
MKYIQTYETCCRGLEPQEPKWIIPEPDPNYVEKEVEYFIETNIKGRAYETVKYLDKIIFLTCKGALHYTIDDDDIDIDEDEEVEYIEDLGGQDYAEIGNIVIFIFAPFFTIANEEGKLIYAELRKFTKDLENDVYKYVPNFDEIKQKIETIYNEDRAAKKYNL